MITRANERRTDELEEMYKEIKKKLEIMIKVA